jgi:hypothetical protein
MKLALRWTIGDVSSRGFETLGLSIRGALTVFEHAAEYVVCVNTISVDEARRRTGWTPNNVNWVDVTQDLPAWLRSYAAGGHGLEMFWKLAPVRLFPSLHELSLDNDVILWNLPDSTAQWMEESDSLLIAEDVAAHYGNLERFCSSEPRNAGIRGLPPHFNAEERLGNILERLREPLTHDCDEQGLQVALVTSEKHRVVPLNEVAICGYFRPHRLQPGTCGAHFVGVNSKRLPWEWQGQQASSMRIASGIL